MLHSTFVCVISFLPFLSFHFLHFHVFVFTLVFAPLVVDFQILCVHFTLLLYFLHVHLLSITYICTNQSNCILMCVSTCNSILVFNITKWNSMRKHHIGHYISRFSYGNESKVDQILILFHNFFSCKFLITYSALSLDIGPNLGVLHVFFKFLFTKFDEEHWTQKFCMSKENVFYICEELKPFIKKQDTKCRNENVMCSFQIGSNSKPFIL